MLLRAVRRSGLRVFYRIRTVRTRSQRPQRGNVFPRVARIAQNGIHIRALGVAQRVLGQQFGVAADDRERRFQVMRQRGHLLCPLLLHTPLGLQRTGKVLLQRAHGVHCTVQLPHARRGKISALQLPLRNACAGGGQLIRRTAQPARVMPCDKRYRCHQHHGEQHQAGKLKIRKNAAQGLVAVKHAVIELKQAQRPIAEIHTLVKPRPSLQRPPGLLRVRQPTAGKVRLQHCAVRGEINIIAQFVRQRCVKAALQAHCGRRVRGMVTLRAGGQHKTRVHQQHERYPPCRRQCCCRNACQYQIAPQQRTQAHISSFFHLYPIPHTVSIGAPPAAFNFARMFFTCSVTAESSAQPS